MKKLDKIAGGRFGGWLPYKATFVDEDGNLFKMSKETGKLEPFSNNKI